MLPRNVGDLEVGQPCHAAGALITRLHLRDQGRVRLSVDLPGYRDVVELLVAPQAAVEAVVAAARKAGT
jgi:hypothetical protein